VSVHSGDNVFFIIAVIHAKLFEESCHNLF
jgi:hypothetical protein